MSGVKKGFCKEICRILRTRNMMNVDYAAVDAFADEMGTEVDVFHARMGMRVVCARDCALVVAIEDGSLLLRVAEFGEEGAKPDDLARAMSARDIFGLAGG